MLLFVHCYYLLLLLLLLRIDWKRGRCCALLLFLAIVIVTIWHCIAVVISVRTTTPILNDDRDNAPYMRGGREEKFPSSLHSLIHYDCSRMSM